MSDTDPDPKLQVFRLGFTHVVSLGVGHLYAHQMTSSCIPHKSRGIDILDNLIPENLPDDAKDTWATDTENDTYHESDNPEMALEDCELKCWDDVKSNHSVDGNHSQTNDSDVEKKSQTKGRSSGKCTQDGNLKELPD